MTFDKLFAGPIPSHPTGSKWSVNYLVNMYQIEIGGPPESQRSLRDDRFATRQYLIGATQAYDQGIPRDPLPPFLYTYHIVTHYPEI